MAIRPFEAGDLDALYEICLATGAAGNDASPLHNDPQLVGQIYAAPYAVLEPAQALVAEDAEGVAGYLVGTYDTDAFAVRQEQDWWPALRQRYADPALDLTETDRMRVAGIMQPSSSPAGIVADYPAHIHMNLRQRLRGQGVGMALLQRWLAEARAAGVRGVHLGASASNTGAIAFWQKGGFVPLERNERTVWFGQAL